MAQATTGPKQRPLSPHLQIWRWSWAMRVSILHRVSGNGLVFVGLPLLLAWLGCLASGPHAYGILTAAASTILGKLVLIGLTWAVFNHMASGLRHFILDIGAGFELTSNQLWSILTPIIALLLTAAFWAVLLLR